MAAWAVEPWWAGERCYILGGGTTLLQKAVPKLKGHIIAVKHTVMIRPDAEIMFWYDKRLDFKYPGLLEAYKGPHKITRGRYRGMSDDILQVAKLKAGADGNSQFSRDPRFLGGNDSGTSALNLAFLLGAREIYLLGFDLGGKHWFQHHRKVRMGEGDTRGILRSMRFFAQELEKEGVKVVNLAPQGVRLDCFKHGDIREHI